jgi:hypothetical protein
MPGCKNCSNEKKPGLSAIAVINFSLGAANERNFGDRGAEDRPRFESHSGHLQATLKPQLALPCFLFGLYSQTK